MKTIHKYWRSDKNLWETKNRLFFINFYVYSIWNKGKVKRKYRLFKYKKPVYLKEAIKTEIEIGRKEFESAYNSNKYLVPINYTVNLDLP